MLSLFMIVEALTDPPAPDAREPLRAALAALPGKAGARILLADRTPANHPFALDGRSPDIVLEIELADADAARAALAADSPLATLPDRLGLPAAAISHQLMEAHPFPVDPGPDAEPYCTFFVTYPGTTGDLPRWLAHYDAHHPPIMRRFPKIRDVATYWPINWTSSLPFQRGTAMQRNKVVFDSLDDLVAALASPVMAEMRADSAGFPPMSARATHFPFLTWRV